MLLQSVRRCETLGHGRLIKDGKLYHRLTSVLHRSEISELRNIITELFITNKTTVEG